jgi:hypothetical protein
MHMHPETVKVVDDSPENDQGFKIINREDLNDSHKLFKEAGAKGKKSAEAAE